MCENNKNDSKKKKSTGTEVCAPIYEFGRTVLHNIPKEVCISKKTSIKPDEVGWDCTST